jgi:hypothetical protein
VVASFEFLSGPARISFDKNFRRVVERPPNFVWPSPLGSKCKAAE